LTRVINTEHEELCTFMIVSLWILLRMRNVSDESCRENQNTHFVFSNTFPKNMLFMRKCGKTVKPHRPQVRIQYSGCASACWIMKATNTHPEYVILFAFRLQRWLRENASMLWCYMYIACLVFLSTYLE